jgi:hypothetical protein
MDTLAVGSPGQCRKTMIRPRIFTMMAVTAAVAVGAVACEPGSITEARDRLGRNATGNLTLLLPLTEDTFSIAQLLEEEDTTSTAGGVLAVGVTGSNFSFPVTQGVAFANQQSGPVDTAETNRLGDMKEPIDQSSLNDATLEFVFQRDPNTALQFDNFLLRAVRVDVPGQPFVLDGSSTPIEVLLADPGLTTLSIPQSSPPDTTHVVSIQAAAFADGILHTLLDNERVALVAQGTTTQGPAVPDLLAFNFNLVVALDVTIPPTGVSFTRNEAVQGVSSIDSADADDIADRLVSAVALVAAENTTPWGATIQIALAPDSLGDNVDVFALPNAVLLNAVSLDAFPSLAGLCVHGGASSPVAAWNGWQREGGSSRRRPGDGGCKCRSHNPAGELNHAAAHIGGYLGTAC